MRAAGRSGPAVEIRRQASQGADGRRWRASPPRGTAASSRNEEARDDALETHVLEVHASCGACSSQFNTFSGLNRARLRGWGGDWHVSSAALTPFGACAVREGSGGRGQRATRVSVSTAAAASPTPARSQRCGGVRRGCGISGSWIRWVRASARCSTRSTAHVIRSSISASSGNVPEAGACSTSSAMRGGVTWEDTRTRQASRGPQSGRTPAGHHSTRHVAPATGRGRVRERSPGRRSPRRACRCG